MTNPKKKPSLRERIKKARRKVAIRRKTDGYPSEWEMHDQIINAHFAYGADISKEALVFLAQVAKLIDQKTPLAPATIQKLRIIWDHSVKPLRENDAS